MDGGTEPLMYTYHQDKVKNILFHNPLELITTTDGQIELDSIKILYKIKAIIYWTKNNYEKENIKLIVLDGLGKLLTICEQQMRLDNNIDPNGQVALRFWMTRNKLFLEIIEIVKSLPISKIFIAHEDFRPNPITSVEEQMSQVKIKTNAMIYTKIFMTRIDKLDHVIFKAKIDKNKYKLALEGKEYLVGSVEKNSNKIIWKGNEVINDLKN